MSDMPRDKNHPGYLGTCEGCSKLLFVGDMGLHYSSGEVTCDGDDCSSTWANTAADWEIPEVKDDEPEGYEAFKESYASHLKNGGSPEDKYITVLI